MARTCQSNCGERVDGAGDVEPAGGEAANKAVKDETSWQRRAGGKDQRAASSSCLCSTRLINKLGNWIRSIGYG